MSLNRKQTVTMSIMACEMSPKRDWCSCEVFTFWPMLVTNFPRTWRQYRHTSARWQGEGGYQSIAHRTSAQRNHTLLKRNIAA